MTSPFSPGDAVVAYLRDSGHEDQELSVEQQEAAIRAWCADQQLLLTRLYIDAAVPGSSTVGRNRFLEMIAYFHGAPLEKGILVWKYNRFARSIDDAQYYKADLRRRGYDIHSLNDSVSNDLNGRFFESAIDWMNARYIEDLRADIKRGLHHLIDQYGGIGGLPPRGFLRVPVQLGARRDGRPHVVHRWSPDPDLVETVRLAFRMRAEGRSLSEINAATHLYGSNVSLTGMFRNRIYIGILEFGDRIIPEYCEPIIDLTTWNAVQSSPLPASGRGAGGEGGQGEGGQGGEGLATHPRRVSSSYLLSGLARCAVCGSPLNGDTVSYRVGDQRKTYRYYACSNRLCNARKIPRSTLEKAVIATLVDVALGEENVIGMQAEFERGQVALVDKLDGQRREVRVQIAEIQRKIDNILDVLADQGKDASPALLSRLSVLEPEHNRLLNLLHDLNAASIPKPTTLPAAQARADRIKQKLTGKDPGQLRRILRGLIDHLIVERDNPRHVITGMVFFYYPPDEDLSENDFMSSCKCPRRDSNPQPRR